MTIAVLCGLVDEAKIITDKSVIVFCGAQQRDNLYNLIPNDCTALLSWGCCGGLTSNIGFGDVLAAREVLTAQGSLTADRNWNSRLILAGLKSCPFYSDPSEGAQNTADRATLFSRTGTVAVDQETCAVAHVAFLKRIPWAAIRSPSDIWNQVVPVSANKSVNKDGSTNIGNVIKSVIKDPSEIGGYYHAAVGYNRALTALKGVYDKIGPSFLHG